MNSLNYHFQITYESPKTYSPPIEEAMGNCFEVAIKGKASGLKIIERAIKKYPRIPQFYHHLFIWHEATGKIEKAQAIAENTIQKFPDYFLAKANLAHSYLQQEKYEEANAVLQNFDLKKLYPERHSFHIDDVILLERLAFMYFIGVNLLDEAQNRLERLRALEDEEEVLMRLQFQLNMSKFSNVVSVKTKDVPQTTKTTPPNFTHSKEIQYIYEYGYLNQSQLDEFAALPRKTLIEDLEKALKDACERYTFFTENEDEDINFCYQSLLLLGHLKAEESLPVVLEFLSESEEVLEFYLDGFITDVLWQVLVDLGENHTEKLFDLLKTPNVYCFVKSAITAALSYIATEHKPAQKQQITKYFEEFLNFLILHKDDENIYDEHLNELILTDLVRLGEPKLQPIVKQMFDNGMIVKQLYASYEEFEQAMHEGLSANEVIEYRSTIQHFQAFKELYYDEYY